MDDLKSRLHFDDINVRCRCIEKLLESIRKKIKGNVIDSNSVLIPELSLILEACQDDSPITSDLAVQAIISLVFNKSLNENYAIDKLILCIKPSSYLSVIKGISMLLMSLISNFEENKVSKFSLLFPKHPLIAALDVAEESDISVIEAIKETLHRDYEKGFQLMQPVILYMFCNPVQKQKKELVKVLLCEALLCIQERPLECAAKLMKIIPLMQVKSLGKVCEVSLLLLKLGQSIPIPEEGEKTYADFFECMLLALFSVAERSIAFGNDASPIIDLLINLSSQISKIGQTLSECLNVCLVMMSYLFKFISGPLLKKVTDLCLNLLNLNCVSPTIAAILALSVIHILPEPSITYFPESSKIQLSKLLTILEAVFSSASTAVNDAAATSKHTSSKLFSLFEAFTSPLQSALICVQFSNLLDASNSCFKLNWLKAVKHYVDLHLKENAELIFSLVSALFLTCPDDQVMLSLCLDTLESLLLKCSSLSSKVFTTLLYKLNSVKSPHSKLLILNFLPNSAVHKFAVPPVLSLLQMLSRKPELKPQAIHLMLNLWKVQKRCFPHLHTMLTEPSQDFKFDSGVNEIAISQASAILEVCTLEPEKHGQDFLSALNNIVNNCQDEANLPLACLAIDGIITLCKAEVIDIRSVCKFLLPRLKKDKRTPILCKMYELLSLVPELEVKSPEYNKFIDETVDSIWKILSSGPKDDRIMHDAFRCLSTFPSDCHFLKQLPPAAKENLKLPASLKATPFEMGKLPEDVLTYIPGYCFIDLLKSFDSITVADGYVYFLRSLIKKEIEDLPRSAYTQSKHIRKPKRQSDVLSKVPEFLCSQFMTMKSPALQKNFAVGVLFCYEPPLEFGKDGSPLKSSIANQSRSFEQVLTVLLSEVNIDIGDLMRGILISNAWESFMERAFFACEEARRTELDLQAARGHLDMVPDGLNSRCKIAWLWVRDRLVGIIKTNTKNTPTTHANAIFAITGLLSALDKFYASLDENARTASDASKEFLPHRAFISEYAETVMCAMFPDYKSVGKVQSWLLTHLSRPNSSANYLVTGCAIAALCHISSIILNNYSSEIPNLINVMVDNLCHNSPVLSFYSGVGLGLFIKSLFDAGCVDSEESKICFFLETLDRVTKICRNNQGNQPSSLIALTLCTTSLSESTNVKCRKWVETTCKEFYERLMEELKSSMQFVLLCICVTAMYIGGTQSNCLPLQSLEDLGSWLEMSKLEMPQCSGISTSLGMLIEAYLGFGHADGIELNKKVSKQWLSALGSEKRPTLQRIAALNGLCSLFSNGRGLVQLKTRPTPDNSLLNELVQLMFQILSAGKDAGLQNTCSWEVGKIFSVNAGIELASADSNVSSSYSSFGEKSVLKPLMNFILSYQKEGEPSEIRDHVVSCLKAIADPFTRPLPPINWATVLSPFLQNNDDPEAFEIALKIAITQSNGSSSAANVISSYCSPPPMLTLSESCFRMLLENMNNLILVIPASKSQIFLKSLLSETLLKETGSDTMKRLAFRGLLNSLKQDSLKDQSKKPVQNACVSVSKHFLKDIDLMVKYLPELSEILSLLPETVFESLLHPSQSVDEISKVVKIWCYFVKTGKKPLKSLWPYIEESQNASFEQKEKICKHIFDCFLYGSPESEVSQSEKCVSWFLEIIGWMKVHETSKSQHHVLTTNEIYSFLMDISMALIIGCSGLENCYNLLTNPSLKHLDMLQSFPLCLNRLCLKNNDWQKAVDKVISWLLMLLKSDIVKEDEKYFIKLSLLSLRGTPEFEKKEVWTNVLCNIVGK